jgi:RNA polymerase sigma factor (sigma-70 family)
MKAEPHVDDADLVGLVIRFQAGESAVLATLHERLRPVLQSLLRRYQGNALPTPITREDVGQQSWVVLAELAHRWQPTGSFVGYVFQAFPHAIDRHLFSLGRGEPTVELNEEVAQVAESAHSYAADHDPVPDRWRPALASLTEDQRTVFVLHAVEKRDFTTVGKLLDMPRASASRLYREARAQIARSASALSNAENGQPGDRFEQLVRALHASVGPNGIIAGRRKVLRVSGLTRQEYDGALARLHAAGLIVDRGKRTAGRFLTTTPEETLRQVRMLE